MEQKNNNFLKFIFVLLVLLSSSFFSVADDFSKKVDVRPIEDLKSQIIVFDNYYNSYVPLIDYQDKRYQSGHLWLDLVKYRGNFIEFEALKGLSLFVNGKFFKKYNTSKKERISVNSFIPFSNGNHVFLSYFHPTSRWPRSINVSVATVIYQIDTEDESKIKPVLRNKFSEFVISGLVLILILIATVKIFFRKTFYSYYSFLNYLRMKNEAVQEDILVMNVLNKEGIIYILLNTVMMSYSFILMMHLFQLSVFEENMTLSEYWFLFGIGSLIFLMIYLLKYLGIYFNALIYKFKNVTNTHFFAFVSYWQKIGLILFVFSLFFCSTLSVFNVEISAYWFNFYLVLIIIILCFYIAFHIRYILSFTNVYLFSYLCVTEVLPVLILYKLYTTSELILK